MDFDKSALQVIIYGGIVWLLLWLISIFSYYMKLDGIDKSEYYNRLTGQYSYGIWIQPIFWFLLTQLYRIKFIKRFLIFRIAISLLFVVTLERFVILATSLHRDYLPNDWTWGINLTLNPYWLFLGWVGKILIFLLLVTLYHFAKRKIKTLYNNADN